MFIRLATDEAIFKKFKWFFLLKNSTNVTCILGYFDNISFQVKTAHATFWASFVKFWPTFYFSIWSYCSFEFLTWATKQEMVKEDLKFFSNFAISCCAWYKNSPAYCDIFMRVNVPSLARLPNDLSNDILVDCIFHTIGKL